MKFGLKTVTVQTQRTVQEVSRDPKILKKDTTDVYHGTLSEVKSFLKNPTKIYNRQYKQEVTKMNMSRFQNTPKGQYMEDVLKTTYTTGDIIGAITGMK